MKEDNCCGHNGHHTLFPELVVTFHQRIIRRVCGTLYHDIDRWLLLSAGIRFVDKPSVEEQSVGGRFQPRERIVHAGNKTHGERVFSQSADQILV